MRGVYLVALFVLVFADSRAALALPAEDASGWHQWTIDNENSETLYVRLESGVPIELRGRHFNCAPLPVKRVTDHGLVSATENFLWFRRFVENPTASENVRRSALFGLVQSDSAQAYDYLDGLISR